MGTTAAENETLIFPPWIELPADVTANILQRLGVKEILERAEKVCATWKRVCLDPAMWRVVDLRGEGVNGGRKFDLMCRCAVDRSQGQMVDLSITDFGGDKLLYYVAHRCSNLRRLVLAKCGCPGYRNYLSLLQNISPLALTNAVKKLPQLEVLHLIKTLLYYAKDIETIGLSCPLLKSFTYDAKWIFKPSFMDDNAVALAIAKTMPNLRHLRLVGVEMKNEGLEAILDGCPHLELLDIRECYDLDLKKAVALGERCSKQIKDLRLPIEPTYCDDSDDHYCDDGGGFDYLNSDDEYDDDYYY